VTSVLIVGGNGFLGSQLVDRLAADGHSVTVFDRYSTPRPRSVALLQAAVDSGVGRVVFASSGGTIYGDQPISAFSELDVPEPVSPYAVGKLAVEGYLRYFRRTHGIDTISLRIANPYGHRQEGSRGQGFIAIALHAVAEGRPVTVFGDGAMVRDYVHVTDVADVIAAVTGRPHEHDVYNLGSGHGVSLVELLEIVERVTGRRPLLEFAETPRSFVHRSVLDISRITDEFGVVPVVSIEDGIADVWRRWGGLRT
jgi:UDP-glucose 4-epimerase